MSLFGANTGFGTGGTGVFGNAATDTHNPMKVRQLHHSTGKTTHDVFFINILMISELCHQLFTHPQNDILGWLEEYNLTSGQGRSVLSWDVLQVIG